MMAYIDQQLEKPGIKLNHITRHMLGLFHGEAGGRAYRRHLSENTHKAGATSKVLEDAYNACLEAQSRAAIRRPAPENQQAP